MKRLASIASLFALLITLVACGSTPNAKYYQAATALGTVEGILATASTNGLLPDDVMVQTEPGVRAAHGALAAAKTQLPAGGDSFDDWLDIATGAISTLDDLSKKTKP